MISELMAEALICIVLLPNGKKFDLFCIFATWFLYFILFICKSVNILVILKRFFSLISKIMAETLIGFGLQPHVASTPFVYFVNL